MDSLCHRIGCHSRDEECVLCQANMDDDEEAEAGVVSESDSDGASTVVCCLEGECWYGRNLFPVNVLN